MISEKHKRKCSGGEDGLKHRLERLSRELIVIQWQVAILMAGVAALVIKAFA